MTRRLPRLRLVAAQDRAELGPLAALTLLVLVTAFLLAAVPRQVAAAQDDALRETVARAQPAELDLSASSTNTAPATQLTVVDRILRGNLGPVLTPRVTTPVRTVQANPYDVFRPDGEHLRPQPFAWLQLAHQPGLLDHVRFVQGEAPDGPPGRTRTSSGVVPAIDVAMAVDVAKVLDLRVGSTYLVHALSPQPGGIGDFAVRLSGTFERTDPGSPRWDYLPQVHDKGERYTAEGALLAEVGAALVDDSQVEALRRAVGTLRYEWHYPVDPGSLDPGSAAAVLAAVRSSLAQAGSARIPITQQTYREPTVAMGSGLVDLLSTHLASARTTSSLVAVVVAGLAVVGLLVLALAGIVVVVRRTPVLALARARGASVGQVVGAVTAGVAVTVLPAAALGGWLARALVGRDVGGRDVLLAGGVGLWAVLCCAAATWWGARTHRRTTVLRPVLEGGLVVLAVLGVVLLRSRADTGGADTGIDPLLAGAPVLVALALAAVLLRALPLVVDRLAAARRSSRGLVSFLGLARAARQPAVLAAPLAALLVALCFAVFATGAVRSVDDAQVTGTWRQVGADYRVEATFIPPEILSAIEDLEGVRSVATAFVRDDAEVTDTRDRDVPGVSVAVDTTAYARVLADAPGGLVDAEILRVLEKGRTSTHTDAPLPVVAASGASEVLDPGSPRADLGGGLGESELDVRATVDRFPLDAGRPTVVTDLGAVRARESAPVRPNTLLVAGAPGLARQLDSIVSRSGQPHRVEDRRQALRHVQESPFVGSTRDLFALVVPAALLYAALATVLALVLAAPARRRDAAVLRRLGASRREALRLALTEQAPPTLGMLLGGALAGLGLVWLALGAVDLSPLTGGVGPPAVTPPLTATALLTGGLLVLVALATAAVSTAERRRPDQSREG